MSFFVLTDMSPFLGSLQCHVLEIKQLIDMARLTGSKLISRILLLISSVSVLSLLALTKCGLGGLVDDTELASTDEGMVYIII